MICTVTPLRSATSHPGVEPGKKTYPGNSGTLERKRRGSFRHTLDLRKVKGDLLLDQTARKYLFLPASHVSDMPREGAGRKREQLVRKEVGLFRQQRHGGPA